MDWQGLGAVRAVVAVALREGAAIIQSRGWTQGRFRDEETGAIDAVQAVGEAVGLDVSRAHKKETRLPVGPSVLLGAALEAACDHLGCRFLSAWNDHEERTLEGVVAGLESAAAALEEGT